MKVAAHPRTRASAEPNSARSRPFFTRAAGVQTRLKVGRPGDRFETEADSVADAVVHNRGPFSRGGVIAARVTPTVQSQAEEEEVQSQAEEEEVQSQAEEEEVQSQAEEEEVQSQAEEEEVQSQAEEEEVQTQAEEDEVQTRAEEEEVQTQAEEEEVQTRAEEDEVQSQTEEDEVQTQAEEEEVQTQSEEEEVQTRAGGARTGRSRSLAWIAGRLRASRGLGNRLPAQTRRHMEAQLGTDLTGVRIHTDSHAVELSRALRAQAFTHGRDIYFNEGRFSPGTTVGDHLIAHELTHTIQQGAVKAGSVQRRPEDTDKPSMRPEGRGDAAGVDVPEQPRAPVDVQIEDDVPAEEPPPGPEINGEGKAAGDPVPLPPGNAPPPPGVEFEVEGEGFGELAELPADRTERGSDLLIQREGDDCPPPEPVPEVTVVPSPAGPGEDPAFSKLKQRTKNRADNQATHETGDKKSADANTAAEVKEGEKQSYAQNDQVGDMAAKAASPPAFDKQAFISSVLKEVQRIAPDTLDDIRKFSERGTAGPIKGAVQGEVSKSAQATQGPLEESATADPGPGTSPRTATPLNVEDPGRRPGSVRADRAMPPPKTESEMDLRADTVRVDNKFKEACVTREFIDKHGDQELTAGAAAQDELHSTTTEAPQTFREGEAAELQNARAGASAAGAKGVANMFGARAGKFGDVGDSQRKTKQENEAKRDAAAQKINEIFSTTQDKVKKRLEKLDKDVNEKFDSQTQAAIDKFERFVDRHAKRNQKSWLDTFIDWFGPPTPEADAFYREGRIAFLNDMEVVIGNVAGLVETGLKEARELVDKGKKEVQDKLESLGPELEDFKQQMSEQMKDKFRTLEKDIDAKQGDIVKGLAERYVKAFERVKEIEAETREKYKNALEKAKDAVEAAVDFVVGWAKKLAAVVGGAAKRIIREPGKFLRNLGAGIVQGLDMFISDIGTNIKAAVVQWLTGNMGGAGVQLPTSFDVKGMIGFLLDLVGLGVAGIKKIARKVFGHKAVGLIEKGVEGLGAVKQIFDILSSEGPSGLLKYLQSEFAKMKEKVMGEVGKALAESLVIAGIKKVLGIISGLVSGGVGTIVTIVLTIIDVVLWFRDNAAQIAELVGTIASMATAILEGQVGAIASAINAVLKRLLPLVLGFVGALVGIGGVVRKIQKIFKAIGKPARNAIHKLFVKFRPLVNKLLAKFKLKGKKGKDKKLSKGKVRKLIITELRKPAKSKDPAKALAETKAQAASLKSKYQPKLKKGNIKITILDTSPDAVEKDQDVDIDVALSPGTKTNKPVKTLNKKMATCIISFLPHSDKSSLWQKEYALQLKDQQNALNKMKVNKWKSNRNRFKKEKRDPSSAKEQEKFRRQFESKMLTKERKKKKKELIAKGVSKDEATKKADRYARRVVKEFMKKNVALHDPDQIAGGSPDAIKRMGLKRVNSSIGSQWRTRVGQLDAHVKTFLKDRGDPKALMKVNLSRG